MTKKRARANNPGLSELQAYIDDMQSQAVRLSGVMDVIAFLENEGAVGAGRTALVYMAAELAEELYDNLDVVNRPEVTS